MDGKDRKKEKTDKKPKQKSGGVRWIVRVFFLSVCLSAVFSLLSNQVLEGANLVISAFVLLFFILLGIFFDIIGVAVTAADDRPFHSMAAHREPGAREALRLLRNAGRVSSFCNDVVGDICGIVSGSTVAVIVVELQMLLPPFPGRAMILSLAVTALTSGLTIGGKAIGKALAIENSTQVLYFVGRFLHLFAKKK